MKPVSVHIELTNKCNNSCKYCPHFKMIRKQEDMNLADFRHIVSKCKNEGITIIKPFLNGESALHPRFIDAVEYIKDNGLTVYLFDNMSLIDKDKTDKLMKILKDDDMIVCSIDSVNKETYIKLRGTFKFEETMENVNYFISEYFRLNQNFHLVIQQVRYLDTDTSTEIGGFNAYFKKWNGKKYTVSSTKAMNWAGAIKGNEAQKDIGCPRLFKDMCILVDGTVCLCCVDYEGSVIIGSIYKNSIEELYSSETFERYRKNFPIGICVGCTAKCQS